MGRDDRALLTGKSDLNRKHNSDETGEKEDSLYTANIHQYAPTLMNSPRLQGRVRKISQCKLNLNAGQVYSPEIMIQESKNGI